MSIKEIKGRDLVEATAKGVLSAIPYTSPFLQAFDTIKTNVIQRRFERWKQRVDERLSKLEESQKDAAFRDDCFATALMRATQMAAETGEEKTVYLANAVQYVAENSISEDRMIIFLNCLQRYTVSHFLILKYFEDPSKYAEPGRSYWAGSMMTLFNDRYPNFDNSLQRIIIRDLFQDGFSNTDSNGTMSGNGMLEKRTTMLGDEFLRFCGIGDNAL